MVTMPQYDLYMLSRRSLMNNNGTCCSSKMRIVGQPVIRLRTMTSRCPDPPTSPQTLYIKTSRSLLKQLPYGVVIKSTPSNHTGEKKSKKFNIQVDLIPTFNIPSTVGNSLTEAKPLSRQLGVFCTRRRAGSLFVSANFFLLPFALVPPEAWR